MPYDPNRHHRHSIRLPEYDYSNTGAYFVTIAVKERQCLLGEIIDGEMRLSQIGSVVEAVWQSLPKRYPGVDIDAFGIMPNHMHGILVITANPVGAVHEPPLRSPAHAPPTSHQPPLRPAAAQDRRRMLLPKIIGYLKMNTAKRANLLRETPGQPFWQRNYYEHVIRDYADLDRIRDYIASNPPKWELDQQHPDNPSRWQSARRTD